MSLDTEVFLREFVSAFCQTKEAELEGLFSLRDLDSWLEPIRKQWLTDVQSIIDQNDFEPEITNDFYLKKAAAATFIGIEFIDLADLLESRIRRKVDLVSRKGIKLKYFQQIEHQIVYV